MRLQHRIALAQLPALLVVVGLLGWGGRTVADLGAEGRRSLADNYRSVQAAHRMGDALGALDRAAHAGGDGAAPRAAFEAELRVGEQNITEPGEREVARTLRGDWSAYIAAYEANGGAWSAEMAPAGERLRATTDRLLALNEAALERQVVRTERRALDAVKSWIFASIVGIGAAALLGVGLTHRVTEPLRRLGAAATAIGTGNLDVRLAPTGMTELDQLADAFHRMAERLRGDRRTSRTALARASETAQAAIESLGDPVLVLTPDGELLTTNAAGRRLLGDPPDLSAADPDLAAAVDAARARVVNGAGTDGPADFSGVVTYPTVDGERAVIPHASPIWDAEAGDLAGVTVLLQDVTRLRRLDQLKGNLVQTAAHELRTPLTSLGMALHLALDERVRADDVRLRELLMTARSDVRRLHALVEDLLDLSRIQAGRMVLRLEAVNTSALLAEVQAHVQPAADARGVTVDVYAPPDPPPRLDRARMSLALTNLAANAIRHSPAGTRVRLAALPTVEGLRFEVSDAGPGVPVAERDRIFEPFVRGRLETGSGAGLGLFIAREVAHAHGGRIGLDEAPGGGARFWIELA